MDRPLDLRSLCGFAALAAWLLLLSPGVRIERVASAAPGSAAVSAPAR